MNWKFITIISAVMLAGCSAGAVVSEKQSVSTPAPVESTSSETVNTGDIVKFGSYQNEEIEWYVLRQDNDKTLLLSVHAVDARPFDDGAVTWDQSSLRAWLNNDFYNTAFDEEEKNNIVLSSLTNGDDLNYGTKTGADTEDHVFLLSASEAEKYLTKQETVTSPTRYALEEGAYANDEGNCAWWLRSPGMNDDGPAYYSSAGDIGTRAHKGSENIIGVRPAVWVNSEAVHA